MLFIWTAEIKKLFAYNILLMSETEIRADTVY